MSFSRIVDLNSTKTQPFSQPYLTKQICLFSAVFANTEIGCDIEHIEKCDSDIVKSYFTDLEREYINKFSGDMYHYASYTIWTLKESFLKAIGVGLNKSMQTFSVVNREGAIKKLIQSDEKEYCLFTKNNMLYSVSICVEINEKKGKK